MRPLPNELPPRLQKPHSLPLLIPLRIFRPHHAPREDIAPREHARARAHTVREAHTRVEEVVEHDGVQQRAERRAGVCEAHHERALARAREVLRDDGNGGHVCRADADSHAEAEG